MEYRALGTTGIEISAIGFGAWAIGGGGWIEGWGPQDDDRSIAAIHRALDQGVNWIDTAGAYGLGHSEVVIERALRGLAERPLVFTKCTSTWDEAGNISSRLDAGSIRREVEGSLQRLRVEALDLCQLHMPVPDDEIEEGWTTLVALRDEGKAAAHRRLELRRRADAPLPADRPVESLQPIYSLLNAELEDELLPYCREHAVGVVVYSPMASGLLTGRHDPRAHRGAARRRLAQPLARLPGAAALAEPAGRATPCARSPIAAAARPGRSRSPGRCATRRSPARPSASGRRSRSTSSQAAGDAAARRGRARAARRRPPRRPALRDEHGRRGARRCLTRRQIGVSGG